MFIHNSWTAGGFFLTVRCCIFKEYILDNNEFTITLFQPVEHFWRLNSRRLVPFSLLPVISPALGARGKWVNFWRLWEVENCFPRSTLKRHHDVIQCNVRNGSKTARKKKNRAITSINPISTKWYDASIHAILTMPDRTYTIGPSQRLQAS